MKISEILHKAADEQLWDGCSRKVGKFEFSCDAIKTVAGWSSKEAFVAQRFVNELGVPMYSLNAFINFKRTEDRQAARYSWLKFAAMVAEEEGL